MMVLEPTSCLPVDNGFVLVNKHMQARRFRVSAYHCGHTRCQTSILNDFLQGGRKGLMYRFRYISHYIPPEAVGML